MEKTCGTCTLCCKLIEISELEKPAGVWCRHAVPGKGCGIYGAHPKSCREFQCFWLQKPGVGPEWKPDRCGFLIREMPGRHMIVDVEPSRPQAWRRAPYYRQIKQWAQEVAASKGLVTVRCGGRFTVVFPETDLAVEPAPQAGDRVTTGYEFRDGARRPYVRVTRPDGAVNQVRG